MSDDMLIEQCCVCGYVHRDDRELYRSKKSHLHWAPNPNEEKYNGETVITWEHEGHPESPYQITLHATVCAECISRPVDWPRFERARSRLAEVYPQYMPERKGKVGYNASLDHYFEGLDNPVKSIAPLSAQYRKMVRAWLTFEPGVKDVIANDPRGGK